jgi:uncharacterized protein (TIGR02996 family)
MALLRACKEALDDDAPRLALADWLAERGEPERAEFIRLQCRLAPVKLWNPEVAADSRRAKELYERYARQWLGALFFRHRNVFDRGLVSLGAGLGGDGLSLGDFLHPRRQQLAGTEAAMWLESFRPALRTWPRENPWAFLDAPLLVDLAVLDLSKLRLEKADMVQLGQSRNLAGLGGLNLGCTFHAQGMLEALVAGSGLAGLQALDMSIDGLGFLQAKRLAKWPRLAQLRVLNLRGNDLGNAGVSALAAAPLASLRRFDLSDTKLRDAGACALAEAPLDNLTRLALMHNGIRSQGVIALARSARLAKLNYLELSVSEGQVGAGDQGIDALGGSPAMSNLAHLGLVENSVSDAGAVAIARSCYLTHLRHLNLCHNQVTDRGALALADSPNLEGIERLDLSGNPIGSRAAAVLRARFGRRVQLDAS